MKAKALSFVLAAVLVLCLVPSMMAQSQFISGTVVDSSGAVVTGAKIDVTDAAKETLVRTLTTDEQGRFQAMNLQPGKYSISAEKAGFKKATVTILLEVNTKLDLGQLKLEVGEITAEVAVTAETPVVQVNTMEKSFAVDNTQIQNLPMNGRNWVALMKTMPGVISSMGNDFDMNFNDVSQFHALGGRGSQNNFYLDGSPNLDVGDNQSQYTQPSIESVSEFKMQQSSFNAEYGRNSGMVVAVQSKSGGSHYHGTAYEFLRNDAMDASNLFTGTKDKLRYNLFGGNVSGWLPIPGVSTKKDPKIFFFYNREMTRRNIVPAGQTYMDVPAPSLLSGDFSASLQPGTTILSANSPNKAADGTGCAVATGSSTCVPKGTVFQPGTITWDSANGQILSGTPFAGNIIPSGYTTTVAGTTYTRDAGTAAMLKYMYGGASGAFTPNSQNTQIRWFYPTYNKLTKDQDLARIDYNVTNKLTTFFRWVNDYQMENFHNSIWGSNTPWVQMQRPKPGSSWSLNLVYTLSPTMASETIFSYNHQSQFLDGVGDSGLRSTAGLTDTNWPQLYPGTNIKNFLNDVTFNGNAPNQGNYLGGNSASYGDPGWHNTGKDYAFTENISWVKKSHTMKFGFYYNRDNKTQTATWGMEGNYNFNSNALPYGGSTGNTSVALANMLLGSLNSTSMSNASVYPWFRFQSYEGYAQDSWKVTPRFTLEYGVRYQYTTPTYTVVRDGQWGGEGTWYLHSLDLTKYQGIPKATFDSAGNVLTPGFGYTSSGAARIFGDILGLYNANGLVCDPCSGVDKGFSPSKSFLSPRLGFAYDLFGDGKTALRGGFGQYVERLRQNNFNFGAGGQFPNGGGGSANPNALYKTPTLPTPTGDPVYTSSSVTPLQGFNIFPADNTMPKIYSWNLGVQHDLGHNLSLDLSYVGNRGTHLMIQTPINGHEPGYLLTHPGDANQYRPFLGYGSITSIGTYGMSRYNAVLMRLGRRFANRVSFNVNYSVSKVSDWVDNDSDNLMFPYDYKRNMAAAGYDATHSITVDYLIQLPSVKSENKIVNAMIGDWQVSGLTHYQSGFPMTVTCGTNLYGIDANPQGTPCNVSGATNLPGGRLNPSAFQRPADGVYGNEKRNSNRLNGYGNWDMSLAKNFRIKESMALKFSMDVFNIFNHKEANTFNTSWATDGNTAGSGANASTLANFGMPTSYRSPRQLQVGLKFTF
jgi:hypothetical protein